MRKTLALFLLTFAMLFNLVSCDVLYDGSNKGSEDYSEALEALEEKIEVLEAEKADTAFAQNYLAVTALLEGDGPYSYREFEKNVSAAKNALIDTLEYNSFLIDVECIRASLLRAVSVTDVEACFEKLETLLLSHGYYKTRSVSFASVHDGYFGEWILNANQLQYDSHIPVFQVATKQDYDRFNNQFSNETYQVFPEYQSDFFEKNSLLIVYHVTSNSADIFDLSRVSFTTSSVCVYTHPRKMPPNTVGATVMGGQLIFIEIPKEDLVGRTSFDAYIETY